MATRNATWFKSSYSGGNGDCVEVAFLDETVALRDTKHTWRKSSYSAGNGNCLEIAALNGDTRAVRDSKNPGPHLTFTPSQWAAFLDLATTDQPED
ncbi:DUF397 domain-containing protein [Streptomyces sp. NBRC 109706]|uniref:DUF397 domain-containing protein n=1 Tax=Streptomyces sp. NBRC 109706 TaxID=1550035 RepID=UPI00078502F7|nr:DUF397 domain-containing protein [Streptomyces sp. NBRC 109706]